MTARENIARAKLEQLAFELWLPRGASFAQVERAIESLTRPEHRDALRKRLDPLRSDFRTFKAASAAKGNNP